MIPHLLTTSSITFIGTDGSPITLNSSNENFKAVVKAVQDGAEDAASLVAYLEGLARPVKTLARIASKAGTDLFVTENHEVSCEVDGRTFLLPHSLGKYLIRLHNERHDLGIFINFIRKLIDNPDAEIVNELWDFISSCGLCLTEDGNFLAYKNVRGDYTSIYDSKTDNTPGTVLSMPRQSVEKNRDRTCSSGLHFAAWDYLSCYSDSADGRTVIVSISPADVVSIPSDYYNQKGRACSYKILRDVKRPQELKDYAVFPEDDE